MLVVTCDYDNGAPAALVAQNAHKISISLCAQDPKMGVQGVGNLAFSASTAAQVQGAAIADWAYEKKNVRKAYVLLDNFIEYDKSVCAGFDAAWSNLPGTSVVGRDVFKNPDPSIATQITKIRNADPQPDAIMLCSLPPGGASAVKQIRDAGINTILLNSQAMDGDYWLNAAPNLSNFYLTAEDSIYGDSPDPAVRDLVKSYADKFGERPPTSTLLLALIQVWSTAVNEAKSTDSAAVVAKMEEFNNLPTIQGPRTFSKDMHIQVKGRYLIIPSRRKDQSSRILDVKNAATRRRSVPQGPLTRVEKPFGGRKCTLVWRFSSQGSGL